MRHSACVLFRVPRRAGRRAEEALSQAGTTLLVRFGKGPRGLAVFPRSNPPSVSVHVNPWPGTCTRRSAGPWAAIAPCTVASDGVTHQSCPADHMAGPRVFIGCEMKGVDTGIIVLPSAEVPLPHGPPQGLTLINLIVMSSSQFARARAFSTHLNRVHCP